MRTLNPPSRQGSSLIELMVVLTLLGITGSIALTLVSGAAKSARRSTAMLVAERTTASLSALVRHDLRGSIIADLSLAGPATLWLDRPVGEAPVCAATAATATLRRSAWNGDRTPVAGRDQVRLLGDPAAGIWLTLALLAVDPASCPDGGAGWRLTLGGSLAGASHARVVEASRLAAYSGTGGIWLGLAGPGDPMQPFAGPLEPAGLALAVMGGALTAQLTPWRAGGARTLRFPVAP